jgi:hypothetical protein
VSRTLIQTLQDKTTHKKCRSIAMVLANNASDRLHCACIPLLNTLQNAHDFSSTALSIDYLSIDMDEF